MNRHLLFSTAAAALIAAVPAAAQDRVREVHPYIEAGQVVTADLQSGDVLTYSSLSAGIDMSVRSRRVEVQLNYRYDHRFDWDDAVADQGVHSGLGRAAIAVTPGLSIEGGAIATRARSDIRGDAAGNLAGNVRNVSQLYSAYVGPTVATHVGEATLNAAYRFGYTKVEEPSLPAFLPGQPVLDNYDSSKSHLAMASLSTRAGTYLPIGLTVSGAWQREDVSQLDQRYDGKFARVDAVLPVTPTVAVVGGVGYEKIEISQRDALVDTTGAPVVDNNGRFVTDPASPRRLSYDTDGLIWDAGVVWRPSRRTMLEARVGQRYNTMIYTGSLSYQINRNSAVQIGVYDSVNSFGRGINNALAALPTSFSSGSDPFGNQFNGCVFGTQGVGDARAPTNAGGCLTPLLGSLTTANFRSRGVAALYSATSGRYRFGLGAGYDNRAFLVPDAGPASILKDITDQTWYAQASVGRDLGRRSSIDANAYFNYFDPGLPGAADIMGGGANASYSYSFGRFGATASAGIYAFDQGIAGSQTDVSAQGLVGMRYTFF